MRAQALDACRHDGRWFDRGQKGSGVAHRSLTFGRRAPSRNAAPCEKSADRPRGRTRRATNPNWGRAKADIALNEAVPPLSASQVAILRARGLTRSPNRARGSRQRRCPRLRYRSGADHEANRPPTQAYCAMRQTPRRHTPRTNNPAVNNATLDGSGISVSVKVKPVAVYRVGPAAAELLTGRS